jgi:flavin reductase (DIM6/NTAB) family NADH-FMN oxidoreductase RutF
MLLESHRLDQSALHRLLKSCVVPRPVAWVSTVSRDGVANLAPYSCFNFVATKPPMICLSIEPHFDGTKKDTLTNIEETREFTINIVPDRLADEVTRTSAAIPSGESEWDLIDLKKIAGTLVRSPRIAECPVSMECRLFQTHVIGESIHTLVIAEVLLFHIEDHLFHSGEVNVRDLHPLARLSGDLFGRLSDLFEIPRDVSRSQR